MPSSLKMYSAYFINYAFATSTTNSSLIGQWQARAEFFRPKALNCSEEVLKCALSYKGIADRTFCTVESTSLQRSRDFFHVVSDVRLCLLVDAIFSSFCFSLFFSLAPRSFSYVLFDLQER